MAPIDLEKNSVAKVAASGTNEISPARLSHLDDNYEIYKSARDVEIDPAQAKRVLRKIDGHIMPILFITYMLQYLDKNSINFASVYGLKKGTGLQGDDYSWLGEPILLNNS